MDRDAIMISILALCGGRACIDAAITWMHVEVIQRDLKRSQKQDMPPWITHCGILPVADLLWAVITFVCAAINIHDKSQSGITTYVLLLCVAASCTSITTTLAAQFHFYAARSRDTYIEAGGKWALNNMGSYTGIQTTSCALQCACLYTIKNRFVQLSWAWWALLVAGWSTQMLVLFMQHTADHNDTDHEFQRDAYAVTFCAVFATSTAAALAAGVMGILFGCCKHRPCGNKSHFKDSALSRLNEAAMVADDSPSDLYGDKVPLEQKRAWYSARVLATVCFPTRQDRQKWPLFKWAHAAVATVGSGTTIVFSWYVFWFVKNTDLHDGMYTLTERPVTTQILICTVVACLGNILGSTFILVSGQRAVDGTDPDVRESVVKRASTSIRRTITRRSG